MEELDQIMMAMQNQNKRIRQQPYGMVYDIDYSGVIGHPSDYLDDFHIYRNASPTDVIRVRINSEGGQLNTLIQLINCIRECQATVITVLESEAHSAAGALFLAGDQYMVGSHAAILIHEPSGGNWDYHSKSKKYQEFSVKHSEEVFADYYEGFLTEDEIESVLDGKDLWLSSEEISERLEIKCAKPEEESFENKMDAGMRETLSTWTKKHLQMGCDAADIPYTTKDTKKQLIEKLLE